MPWQPNSIAERIYAGAPRDAPTVLPRAGTSLENPWVYDSVAREIKEMASGFGDLEILDEDATADAGESLITRLVFRRR